MEPLDKAVRKEARKLSKSKFFDKEFWVDTGSYTLYTLLIGLTGDFKAGLKPWGIFTARISSGGINLVINGTYGKWRNYIHKVFKSGEQSFEKLALKISDKLGVEVGYQIYQMGSPKVKEYFANLVAINTFRTPIYAGVLALSTFISEGKVNPEKVEKGVEYIMAISPIVCAIGGWYMDKARKLFGLKSAKEKSLTE